MEGLRSLPIIDRIARNDGYRFPFCDMRHEALKRDQDGRLTDGSRGYIDQCPAACRANRPACAHFAEDDKENPLRDPIQADIGLLTAENVPGAAELFTRYEALRRALNDQNRGGMDQQMREARCGTTSGGDIPTSEAARQAAALLIPRHRELVTEMKTVVAEIGAGLRILLQRERASSMMEPCDGPSSSSSGSQPTPRSSSPRTPSDTLPVSDSSSRPISHSTST